MKTLSKFITWESALVVLLVLEVFVFGSINPPFLKLENRLYSVSDFAHIILACLPLTLVIITGGIDISIASMMGLSSIILGVTWASGVDVFLAMGIALLVGALAGMFNGLLVANTDINPLVITLGTLFLFSGSATAIAGSLGASGYEGISGMPREFTRIALGSIGPIPYPLILVLVLAGVYSLLLHATPFGRSLYLIGVNREAAEFSGIPVKRILVAAYALSGLGAAMAGVMLTAYFTSARSDLGAESLLPAITAVVLGGTSILGGSGTVIGTLIAAITLGYLKQGLLALGVTSDVSQVVIGGVLVAVIALKMIITQLNQVRLNRRALRLREAQKGGA